MLFMLSLSMWTTCRISFLEHSTTLEQALVFTGTKLSTDYVEPAVENMVALLCKARFSRLSRCWSLFDQVYLVQDFAALFGTSERLSIGEKVCG
jgi:hypothetical protein